MCHGPRLHDYKKSPEITDEKIHIPGTVESVSRLAGVDGSRNAERPSRHVLLRLCTMWMLLRLLAAVAGNVPVSRDTYDNV